MVVEEALFTITKDHLETGLRGYPVGYCTTSSVDPEKGLLYLGIPVKELAFLAPEEVIFLLYYGYRGSKDEIANLTQELRKRAKCTSEFLETIKKLPCKGSAMKMFSSALLLNGMLEGKDNYKEDCLDLIAKIPIITAAVINHHAGWNSLLPSKPELGYIENFVNMLNIPNANPQELIPVMKLFNVLHYDHGGGNLSTFVGKAVASGNEDMYGSLTAAMCALAGPKHGKANQDSLAMVKGIFEQVGGDAKAQQVEEIIRKRLDSDELVYGFGHAVLRVEDPRATILYKVADEKYPNDPLVKITRLLRNEAPQILKNVNSKIADPYPNVDAISGILLTASGFSFPEYYTVLFGMARVVGISIQIVYERCEARNGKGTPIVRPKYFFKNRMK